MARKKYKIVAAVVASKNYIDHANQYRFKVGFQQGTAPPLVICNVEQCPVISVDGTTVMGTDNEWAQRFLAQQLIPSGIQVDGANYYGTPVGAKALEETTDPETLDLDQYFV